MINKNGDGTVILEDDLLKVFLYSNEKGILYGAKSYYIGWLQFIFLSKL